MCACVCVHTCVCRREGRDWSREECGLRHVAPHSQLLLFLRAGFRLSSPSTPAGPVALSAGGVWADVGHAILSSSFTVTCRFSRFIPPLGPRAGCPRQGCFSTQAPVGSMCNSPLSWTRGLTEAGLAAVCRRDLGVPRPCGVAPSQPTLSVTPVLCVWRSGRGGHGPATRRVPGVHGGGERRLLWWPPRRERGRSRARPSPSASILSLSDIVHGGFSHCF